LIYETEHEWSILSVDGIQRGDSMMVILGETDESPGYTEKVEKSFSTVL